MRRRFAAVAAARPSPSSSSDTLALAAFAFLATAVALTALASTGCSSNTPAGPSPSTEPDAGSGPCVPQCSGRQCGPDSCGGTCGDCPTTHTCNATSGRCECTPETDLAFCQRTQVSCGYAIAADNCGVQRTVSCDLCTAPQSCDPLTRTCSCTPETNGQFCRRNHVACGALAANDNCGAARSVDDCGSCARASSCDPHGQCVCAAESDAEFCGRLNKHCGPAAGIDNCNQPRRVASCGACGANAACDVLKAQCLPCEDDATFCARNGHHCGSYTGLDNCGAFRTVEDCGACTPPRECRTDGHCAVPGRPYNDDCFDPATISFDAYGRANLRVDTTGATDSGAGSCYQGTGNDVVFSFTLPDPRALEITATSVSGVAPAFHLRQGCDLYTGEVACAPGWIGHPATLSLERLPAGTYFLWVDATTDGAPGGVQDVTLAVSDPPTEPVNNLCISAELLQFAGAPTATVVGTTRGATNETTGTCGDMPGADVVYAFSIARASSVEAVVTSMTTEFLPDLYLVDSCRSIGPGAAHELGCATHVRETALLSLANLAPGDYYLVVDGATPARGDFSLEVTLGAPILNDTCATAQLLVFDPISHAASVQSNTRTAADDAIGSCGFPGGGDLVYAFDTPASPPAVHQDVEITVTPDLRTGLLPVVYARTSCADASTELACAARMLPSKPAVLRLRDLAPSARYYVFVDGMVGAVGRFSLTATTADVQPPPANDVCAAATSIAVGGTAPNPVSIGGSTAHATNDSSGSCGGVMDGPDVAYSFTLTETSAVVARVTPNGTGYAPAVYIRSSCAGAAADLGCGTFNEVTGAAFATAPSLAPGTYEVIVDGTDGSQGDFTLELTLAAPFDNFTCTAAQTLVVDATTRTATVTAADTRPGPDATGSTCAPSNTGHEVFYAFNVPAGAAMDATIDVKPLRGSALVADVSIRAGDCRRRSAERACTPPGSTTTPLTVRNLPGPATYYVVVQGAMANADGPFSMTFTLVDAPPPPANEACASVADLAIDSATGVGRTFGNLVSAQNDFVPSCAGWYTGPDAVYRISLRSAQQVEVTLAAQTGSALVPLVALTSSCDASGATAAAEVGCGAAYQPGVPALMVFPRLAAGDYYLIVDSDSADASGPFDLTVQLRPPTTPPGNNACAGATTLAFDTATNQVSTTGDTTGAANEASSYCATADAPLTGGELIYRVELLAPASVTAKLTRAAGNTLYAPALSIRTSCAPADEVACAASNGYSAEASLTVSLPAGEFFVFVDGVAGPLTGNDFGPFTLELSKASAVPADGCGIPGVIALDTATGRGSATGDLNNALPSTDGSCVPGSGNDLVFKFDIAQEKTVKITATPSSLASHARPAIYLRRTCGDPMSEFGCSDGTTADSATDVSIFVRRLPAGTWYLWVDAREPTGVGPVTLTIETSDPTTAAPGNDACAGATAIALDPSGAAGSRSARLVGDTTWATNDFAGGCGLPTTTAIESGPDLAYLVTLAQPATLVAVVQHDALTSSLYLPAITLRAGCGTAAAPGSPDDELACGGRLGMPSASFARALAAGTYLLVVDGQEGSAGQFVLDLVARPAAGGGDGTAANDGCTSAEAIALDAATGLGRAGGMITAAMASDDSGTCVPGQGADAVFSFTTAATKDVALELLPGSAFTAAMYVRSTCGDPATEKACIWDMRIDRRPRIALARLPAGTWYVWVGALGAPGETQFTLTVQASDPAPAPANDVCRGALPLVFDQTTGIASASGDTTAAYDDYAGVACARGTDDPALDGPDLVYSFSLSAEAAVTASVMPATGDPNFQPALYIRTAASTCGAASTPPPPVTAADEVLCVATPFYALPMTGARGTVTLPRGDYNVFVDGVNKTSGHFTLELRKGAAIAGDSCLNAVELQPDTSGVANFSGDTRRAANSTEGSCTGGAAPDLVYGLTLAEERSVEIEVTPNAGSQLQPAIYVRRACEDASVAAEVLCTKATQPAGVVKARLPRLAAGHYAIWIDGSLGMDSGMFAGRVTVSVPAAAPANDACAGAQALNFGSTSVARVTGETWLAHDDARGTCDETGTGGPDVVYSFTLTAPQQVVARVTSDPVSSPDYVPVVSIRSACEPAAGVAVETVELTCARADDQAAAVAGPGTALVATASVNTLPRGTYYVWVDGAQPTTSQTPGAYALEVMLGAPVAGPANESCPAAQALGSIAPGTSLHVTGTTVGAQSEAAGTCDGGSASRMAGDVVYAITLGQEQKITARVVPSANYTPMVYVRRACGSGAAADELACAVDFMNPGAPVSAVVGHAPAGTYWIWVDGASAIPGSRVGTFTLEVAVDAPVYAPANDQCGGAIALTRGAAAVSGDTTQAVADYGDDWYRPSEACAGYPYRPLGREVVYRYMPSANGAFTVSVTSVGAGFDPVLWYGTGFCGEAYACHGVADDGGPGEGESLTINGVAGTPYFIYVDAWSMTQDAYGTFAIAIQ